MKFDNSPPPHLIGYHAHPVNAQGSYIRDTGMFSDMDVYADFTPKDTTDAARETALAEAYAYAERELAMPGVAAVYIRESHQPAPGQSWVSGPHVAKVERP